MHQYVTPAALAFLLAAGGCSAKHASDRAAVSSAEVVPAATPATNPAAPAVEPATISVPAELPPPPKKPSASPHHRQPDAAHRVRPLEDPRRIPQGISYDEMVRRFGPPNMAVTDGPGRSSLSYSGRSSRVQVEIQDGHVISVASSSTGR